MAEPDAGDFEEFAEQALPALLRFGHVLTGSPQEAEDLIQEAMAKSLRRWRTARADDPVAYVRKVMVEESSLVEAGPWFVLVFLAVLVLEWTLRRKVNLF